MDQYRHAACTALFLNAKLHSNDEIIIDFLRTATKNGYLYDTIYSSSSPSFMNCSPQSQVMDYGQPRALDRRISESDDIKWSQNQKYKTQVSIATR